MQILWSKVLAGEANSPGLYSKRTVNLLASFDKIDADYFCILCSFAWRLDDTAYPLIYDYKDKIYAEAGLSFSKLFHLERIGLISFDAVSDCDYGPSKQPSEIVVGYFGTQIKIKLKKQKDNIFKVGKVLLSQAGQELAEICGSTPREGFVRYSLKAWKSLGYKVSENC